MNSSDSNTSLSTDQTQPSQQNNYWKGLQIDRQRKFSLKKKHSCNLCLEKNGNSQ